jgi:hypothetical protein
MYSLSVQTILSSTTRHLEEEGKREGKFVSKHNRWTNIFSLSMDHFSPQEFFCVNLSKSLVQLSQSVFHLIS